MTTIEWTVNDKAARVTVSLERRVRRLGTDDHVGAVTRDEGLEVRVEAHVDGMGVVGTHYDTRVPASYRALGVVATVGKLAVMAPQADEIAAAIAAAKADPEYVAQQAQRAANRAALDDLDASRRRIERTA